MTQELADSVDVTTHIDAPTLRIIVLRVSENVRIVLELNTPVYQEPAYSVFRKKTCFSPISIRPLDNLDIL